MFRISAVVAVLAGMAAFAGPGRAIAGEFDAWAAPGAYRIHPVGGDGVNLDAAKVAALKKRNDLWDEDKTQVTLAGARREVVGFQLILQPRGKGLSDVRLAAGDLTGPAGKIPAGSVRMFLVGYVPADGKFFPDILVPLEAGKVHPFSIPHQVKELPAVPGQTSQAVWVDVEVPADAKPGTYAGQIEIVAREDKTIVRLALEVLDLEIPLKRSVAVVLDQYTTIIKGPTFKDDDEMIELEKQFYRLAHEHRQFINVIRYPQKGDARPKLIPDIKRGQDGKLAVDWTFWDKRYGAYLDGSAFADRLPIEQFCLYFNQFWPAEAWPTLEQITPGGSSPEKARFEAAWMEHAREYVKHFKEKGWDKVKFTIKMNHYSSASRTFVLFNTDCPRNKNDAMAVQYFGELTHRAFKDMPPLTMRFRMDTGHSFCSEAGCKSAWWDECKAGEIMKDVDLWFFEWKHGLSHLQRMAAMKAAGKEVYVYYHGWDCRKPSSDFQGLGWVLWAAGVDGYNGYNNPQVDLSAAPANNYVMYLGWKPGGHDAFGSVRLKLQREGLYDYELLRQAKAKDPAAVERIVKGLVTFDKQPPDRQGGVFTGPKLAEDPAAYRRARRELIAILK